MLKLLVSRSAWLAACLGCVSHLFGISGDYLEVRSCDVYTGPCFANAEMGLTGKEGILVWTIREGQWQGQDLAGLNAIAVVSTDQTLGDVSHRPRKGRSVLILDAKATPAQRDALMDFMAVQAGDLISEVALVKSSSIEASIGECTKHGCATVKASGLVEIATRCLGAKDHICGNEEMYYPPLTKVRHPMPAYTECAAYRGNGLPVTWQFTSQRSAYLAGFEY